MAVQSRDFRLSHSHLRKFLWRNKDFKMIISIYLFNMQKQYNGSNPEILWFPRDIIVFRLFAYLLYIICLNQLLLYKTSYIYRFSYILTQFYINFSRQEHQIDVLYVSFNAWDSQVSSYTPSIFPLQSL